MQAGQAPVQAEPHLQIRHIGFGYQHRQPDIDRRRPLLLLLRRRALLFQRMNGLFEHGLIKLVAHLLDMTGLLLAEQVTRAAQIEVVARQRKAGAQAVERMQHLEPLLRLRRDLAVRRDGEHGVAAFREVPTRPRS